MQHRINKLFIIQIILWNYIGYNEYTRLFNSKKEENLLNY